ncbi:hypothetical protein CK203_043519 [Vitis vinifera]|uniref:Uncharacterized protein n=1 Tax=Vitis vinifera TaxID=29760 RepID=A0A438HRE2_VITVI|nr:hypothetical protein CK203_043519 [Vitis vinifera]
MCLPQGTRSHDRNMQSLQYLVERLIKAGHLKQYSDQTLRKSHFPTSQPGAPRAPAAPKAVINYINGGHLTRSTTLGEKGKNYGTIIFPPVDPTRTLQPHRDALIFPRNRDFDVRRIWLTQAARPILCKHQSLATWDTVSQASKTLDESCPDSTDLNYILGRHYTAGPSWPSHSQRTILVVQSYHPSMSSWAHMATLHESHPLYISSNAIIGSGGQRSPAADPLQTIQISEENSPHEHQFPHDARRTRACKTLRRNHDIFAWAHSDMKGIHPSIASHRLNVFSTARPVRQKIRRFHPDRQKVIRNEIDKLLKPDSSEK